MSEQRTTPAGPENSKDSASLRLLRELVVFVEDPGCHLATTNEIGQWVINHLDEIKRCTSVRPGRAVVTAIGKGLNTVEITQEMIDKDSKRFEPASPEAMAAMFGQLRESSPPWRVGQSMFRTLYFKGQLVGLVDTAVLAREIVEAMNERESNVSSESEGTER